MYLRLFIKGRRPFILLASGVVGFLSWLPASFANPKEICQPRSYEELVRCAVSLSAEIQISDQQLKAATYLEGIARQRLNPELEVESVQKNSDQSETTAALLFDIRLGGKRKAAINEAKAEIEKSRAQKDLDWAKTKLDFILDFYKLRHIESEKKLEEESISTFAKIINQFLSRAALSPEQQVSLSIFRMALADHQLSLARLKSEEEKILQELTSSTDLSREQILANLPSKRTFWPDLKSDGSSTSSPHLRFAQSELMLAKSQSEKASADSWPDLKLGPAFKAQKDGGASESFFGFALSMPLPVLSLNTAGRNHGQQKVVEAEMNLDLMNKKLAANRSQLVERYQKLVSTIKSSMSTKIVDEKHEQIERLFFKGVVPSSLVIEAHRQLIDLEKNKNDSEREAIEALGAVLTIDNAFSEVIL